MSVIAYSGNSTFVPSLEASGSLVVNYSRNVSKFPVNSYVAIKKVSKKSGYYNFIDPDEAARVINTTDFVWPDGEDMPMGNVNGGQFTYLPYNTTRYAYPFTLGFNAVDQASWNVLADHGGKMAAKAMTARTLRVVNALKAASWGSNTGTVTSVGGAFWGAATTTNLAIKKSILGAAVTINQATNGVVQLSDLNLVLSPTLATTMSETDEIHNYMKGTQFAMEVVRGVNFASKWGLPEYLYGVKVVVEDAVVTATKKGQARSGGYVLDSNSAFLLARPDGLDAGLLTGPTYSTICMFAYEEFTVESFTDINNRRYVGRVVEDTAEVVTAPAAGYYFTHALS